MPIRATSDQEDLHAFALNAEEWAKLKSNYRGLKLHMPCCGVAAVPKTSARGTYFFAHARRGECITADESPEHIFCKSLIAKAALDAGWTVTTERPGVSPGGEAWIADVFCEKGTVKLALEVQMSPQSDEETIRRQLRYKSSGVRGAWFFGDRSRQAHAAFGQETPAFSLQPLVVGELPKVEGFSVSLTEFVKAMLQKQLFWTIPSYSRPHLVEFIEDVCWACKATVKQVIEHLHGGSSTEKEALIPADFYAGRWNQQAYTVSNLSNLLEAVQTDITNDELAAQGMNLIGRRDVINGKSTRYPYCNLCVHCRAPQNNHFLSKRIYAAMQGLNADEEKDLSLDAPENVREQELAFGVAMIARKIEGCGTWVLRETSQPSTP